MHQNSWPTSETNIGIFTPCLKMLPTEESAVARRAVQSVRDRPNPDTLHDRELTPGFYPRKGRRRKIRCVWSSDRNGSVVGGNDRTACDHCIARGKTCIPQLQKSRPSSGARTTARDRINHLEREMASLAALVRDRHDHPSFGSGHRDKGGGDDSLYEDLGDELDRAEVEGGSPPSHLRLLFDSFAVNHQEDRDREGEQRSITKLLKGFMRLARSKLRPLLPSHEEVLLIAEYASDWMTLYHALFPSFFAFRTGEQLVLNYEKMHDGEVHPASLAMYLLSIAITAQQIPSLIVPASFYRGQGVTRFVDAVCRTVERTIVGNDALAGTAEGLETAMLYVRLSLGRGNLKGTWLTFRRIIALAELIGLPQANDEFSRSFELRDGDARTKSNREALKLKADVWEAICATDRNFSMMLNFPAGTARYRFPRDESVWCDGQVSPQAYNYRLSNICAAIFEIDESYVRGASHAESYEKVLGADRQLRALAAEVPKIWWYDSQDVALSDLLVKFWHSYLTVRIHLRPGMMNDSDEVYVYSRSACLNACYKAVRRFPKLRPRVPSGFFVCRVLDVQVFTAATFLLLSSRVPQQGEQSPVSLVPIVDSDTIELVQQVVDCFASVSHQAGSDLAREATAALTSLIVLVQNQTSDGSQPLTLQIPLLGKIHITGPSTPFSSQKSSVDPGSEHTSPEMSEDYQKSTFRPEVVHHHSIEVQDVHSATAGPFSWSFEFDDPSLWARGSFLPDNMGDGDLWTDTGAEYNEI